MGPQSPQLCSDWHFAAMQRKASELADRRAELAEMRAAEEEAARRRREADDAADAMRAAERAAEREARARRIG